MSHAEALRDHHSGPEEQVIALVRALYDAAGKAAERPQREALRLLHEATDRAISSGAGSFDGDRALLRFALRLALSPRSMRAEHLEPLRAEGWSDREIHDAVHVVACFSYMNRLADGLGVAVDGDEWAVRLLGRERYEAHRAWAEAR